MSSPDIGYVAWASPGVPHPPTEAADLSYCSLCRPRAWSSGIDSGPLSKLRLHTAQVSDLSPWLPWVASALNFSASNLLRSCGQSPDAAWQLPMCVVTKGFHFQRAQGTTDQDEENHFQSMSSM